MASRSVVVFLVLSTIVAFGQALSSMNFSYCYDGNNEIEFQLYPSAQKGKFQVFYSLTATRKEFPLETYSIDWQQREDFNDRSEDQVMGRDSVLTKEAQNRTGIFKVAGGKGKWYLVAKVTNQATQNTFHFFCLMDDQWPLEQFVTVNNKIITRNFVAAGTPIKFQSDKPLYAFYYKESFKAALPPFAEAEAINPFLITSSSFSFTKELTPRNPGLYLIQSDTTSAKGVCLLVTDASYPKYTSVAALAPPLVYITTDDEYLRLSAANTDKPTFDKVILEITNDKERAKNLMRSYFQRVELANRYFTDYKEGWKTDRGMLYIIYGKPDEVSRTASGETWFYEGRKTKFEFKKSGSVFNPENYKLERDNKYMVEWFTMVDLWRKSRY